MKKVLLSLITLLSISTLASCNDNSVPEEEHTHAFSNYYAYNETHHWNEATCGHNIKQNEEKHNFGEWFTTIAPTVSKKGQAMRQCKKCFYCETKILDEVDPTIEDSENKDNFGEKKLYCDWAFGDYDIDSATRPFWDTKIIYQETLTFADKNDMPELLYNPTEIISVYDYGLEIEYKEGEDFTVEGNKLKLTDNTKIKYWGSINPSETLYLDTPGSITIQSKKFYNMTPSQTKYVFYSESIPNKYQLKVTYKTNDEWKGYVPVDSSSNFTNTISLLNQGKKVNVSILGDSISFGRGSSSDLNSFFRRNTPCYANLFYEYLVNRFPNSPIVFDNQAVGGTTASWGTNTGINKLINVPDFLIVAFGMNDDGGTPESYANNINSLVNKIHQLNPNCEILLLSPMLDNPDRLNHDCHLKLFEDKLIDIANKDETIGVATMTSMCNYLYSNTGVRFEDVASNNYNHPNDFIHRLYAQVALKGMLGDLYTNLK